MIRTSTARNRTAAALAAIAAATLAATAQAGAEPVVQRDIAAESAAVAPISGIVLGDPGAPASYRAVMSCVVLESGSSTGSTGLCAPRPVAGSDTLGQAGVIVRGDRPEQVPTDEGPAIARAVGRVVGGA